MQVEKVKVKIMKGLYTCPSSNEDSAGEAAKALSLFLHKVFPLSNKMKQDFPLTADPCTSP